MALLFATLGADLAALLALGAAALYWLLSRNLDYWKKRNIPYVEPHIFFGNLKDSTFMKKSPSFVFQELYKKLDGHPYGGVFQLMYPTLLLRDPEIIKVVTVKDFPHFQDRGFPMDKKNTFSQNLFGLGGFKWRHLRMKLSPTFTSGKMKMMFHAMEECSRHLQQHLAEPAARGEVLELKEILAKFSTDVIGTCAFGLQMNALENPDSEFRVMGRRVFEPSTKKAIMRAVAIFLPTIARLLKISGLEPDVATFFRNVIKETVDYRENNGVRRNDFLQLLIELKNKGKVDEEEQDKEALSEQEGYTKDMRRLANEHFEMDDGLLAAQVFIFFLAGFETSSTTMSFAFHELAVNPDVQSQLRKEIDAVLEETGGKFTYEAIMSMKYLDKVISETLRKYPPVGHLIREVTIPYTLSDINVHLEKGTKIVIPVYALHHDPKYFPEPERFDPERFSEEQRAKRPHYVYLPFGEGPRNCIGMRFGLLQTKMGLAALLAKYEFHVCERTEIPLRIDPRSSVTASYSGTVLRVTARR